MDKNIKIAVLTTYFDPEENGLTRYINGLYCALLDKHLDIEVDVITFDTMRTGKYSDKTKYFNIFRIDCIPILDRTYAIPTKKGRKQLHQIFEQNPYDFINTHTRFFLTSYYGIKFGEKYLIPVIHTEHGSGFVKHSCKPVAWIAKVYDYTLGKYVFKNADLVCGVSRSACDFSKKLGARKTEVVYNGIDTKFWEAGSRKQTVISNDVIFTFVGRLIPEKGVQDLIEALSEIKTNWKLNIIGDGHFRNKLEKLVKKYQLEDKIQFLGAKSQKEIQEILQKSDLFINPSIASEGLPTTILEAAVTGCRVLSSDKGGSVEVLGKENLFEAGNLAELKEKILNYKKIPVTTVEKFDWQNIAKKYFKLLKKYSK